MAELRLFKQYQFFREMTLNELKGVTNEEALIIPEGFSNSILWNAGHLLVTSDSIITNGVLGEEYKYKHLQEFFNRGTKPSEWTKEPPTLEEIMKELSEQLKDIEAKYEGKLNSPLENPFSLGVMELETGADYFNFGIIHESLHIGVIKGLKYALKGKK